MPTLEEFQKFNAAPLPSLGESLGAGTQGKVFALADDPDKVMKISSIESFFHHSKDKREKSKSNYLNVMGFLKRNYYSCFPKIYDYGIVDVPESEGEPNGYAHYSFSIVERLKEISFEEQKLLEYINSFIASRNANFTVVTNTIDAYIKRNNLTLDVKRILDFYIQVICVPIDHNDLAGCNFMKDNTGDYKLIDFDRASLSNFMNKSLSNNGGRTVGN